MNSSRPRLIGFVLTFVLAAACRTPEPPATLSDETLAWYHAEKERLEADEPDGAAAAAASAPRDRARPQPAVVRSSGSVSQDPEDEPADFATFIDRREGGTRERAAPTTSSAGRSFQRVAEIVTMPYLSKGRVIGGGTRPVDSVKKLYSLRLDDPRLEDVPFDYGVSALALELGYELRTKRFLTMKEAKGIERVFMAGLTGRPLMAAGDLLRALFPRRYDELQYQIGTTSFEGGIELQSSLWRRRMLPLAQEHAGPDQLDTPLRVDVASDSAENKTGLKVTNIHRRSLRNVTLSIRSSLAPAGSPMRSYHVFIRSLGKGQTVYLHPATCESMLGRKSVPMRDALIYSLWSDQGRAENVTLSVPAGQYSAVRRTSGPFKIRLVD